MVSMTPNIEIKPAGISNVGLPLGPGDDQPESFWRRADRNASYVFFGLFGGGGLVLPLAIMIYSWFR